MIYLMVFSVTQNCLQITTHYLQHCIILKNDLNNDLTKITKWAFQWKMSFNPDISKQAHEVIFFRKRSVSSHPPLITYQLLKRIPKNIWECSLIRN